MTTLEDAWKWYADTKRSLKLVRRLAGAHWGSWGAESKIGRDDLFRNVDSPRLDEDARGAALQLEEFAVFALFAAFEAEVRGRVLADTARERASVSHTALRFWMGEAEQSFLGGSFFRVLDALKTAELNDLIEQVNQVRRYRNWVAHGRREEPQAEVTPPEAYRRLRALLDALYPPPPLE